MSWPINPQFLSKYIPQEEEYTPNKHGLFESDTLRGFMVDASDDKSIRNPLSLFQVVPSDYYYEAESDGRIESLQPPKNAFLSEILGKARKIIRIDPRNLYPNMYCCDAFRENFTDSYGCNFCFEQDSQILILYHEKLSAVNYSTEFKTFVATLQEICNQYNSSLKTMSDEYKLHVQINEEKERLYIWYKCKYSNLYEYFFPIVYSGKIVAVLMQGQRISSDMIKTDIFKLYRGQSEKLENSIQKIPNEKFTEEAMSQKREDAIFNKIKTLELRIEQEVLGYARSLISNKFNQIQKNFRNELKQNTNSDGKIALTQYSIILDKALQQVCTYFNPNGFIRMYTAESALESTEYKNTKFYLIGTSDPSKRNLIPKEIVFEGISGDELDERENDLLARYTTRPQIELKENDIFRIEPLQVGRIRNLIWKNYNYNVSIDKKQFELYAEALKSMYHMFLEPYHVLNTIEMQERLEISMRVSVHEAANIIPTIYTTLKKEYGLNNETLERIREGATINGIKKRERTLYDTIQRLFLIDSLYRKSTLIFKNSEPHYSWTDLHRTMYSVQTLFEESALKNKLQNIDIEMDPIFDKFDFLTDKAAFNHILFNLLDNAIKYGLRGSNIRIKVEIPSDQKRYITSSPEKIDTIIVSVINYGFKILDSDRDKLFDLYYRSEQSSGEQGRGIGLFLVQRLCNALEYQIENAKSKLVYKYHAPVMYYYILQYPDFLKNERLPQQIKDLLSKEIPSEIVSQVVNTKNKIEWKIGRGELTTLLPKETYENKFILTIKAPDGNQLLRFKSNDYE